MTMEDIDLKTFEKRLDEIIDQVAGESVDLIIERPRYIHAVMVIAEDDDEGQIIQASRVKNIDPITSTTETFNDFQENTSVNTYCKSITKQTVKHTDDDDIEVAIRRLEQSRDLLNEN
ncbi:unnamed protein product [Enterobius vermicularis]|uniref:Phage protein n=1 Tax=Enterobius vermicularis TaxID=51028 RepID=A0A0N4V3T8_ENTVE|nr:unnamed protein product [Enterobius vermicularis]